jgi:hypothetical protein
MNLPNFDMKKFNGLASILIAIMILASLGGLIFNWNINSLFGRIMNIASIFFYCLLFWLFYDGYKKIKQTDALVTEDELKALVEQYK